MYAWNDKYPSCRIAKVDFNLFEAGYNDSGCGGMRNRQFHGKLYSTDTPSSVVAVEASASIGIVSFNFLRILGDYRNESNRNTNCASLRAVTHVTAEPAWGRG